MGKLGADAVAAVGLTASLIILIFAVGLGIAMTVAAMVARRIGEGDLDGATKATGQAFWASLVSSVPIGILAILVAGDLLRLMGASESVIDSGSGYAAILLGGNITIILLFLFNAVFRSAGDPASRCGRCGWQTSSTSFSIRIVIFALLPFWGISNAAATMVGQNLGANKAERGERAVWICTAIDAIFLGLLGAVFWFAAAPILNVVSTDSEVVRIGVRCLRILALFFPIWAVGMVAVQSFNGAGDTRTPTWINLIAYWVLQLPLAWLFAWPLGMGEDGIFWAIAASQLALAVIAASVFRKGRWKNVIV